jgi:DNA processing protein
VTVVSGLARGIDAAAHQGALKAGGRTIAVLASGLANIYPPEHQQLAEEVAAQGALISEAPLDGPPIGGLFPQRNRIISGLSLGIVVVEAAARSGALSTAHHALEQNRDVFAVPGRVGDLASEGTNQLIRDGACLVRHVDDILEHLGPIEVPATSQVMPPEVPTPSGLDANQTKLWEAVGTDDVELEVLLDRTGLRASEASASLLLMEMRKLIRRLPGNRYQRR